MSTETKIEWTDKTWNPVRGCSRVSPGCDHCYAMGQAHRFSGAAVDELGEDGKPLPGRPVVRREGPYHGLTVLRPKTAKRPGVDWSGRVRFVPEMLGEPLRWREPKRIFVNSMSDLFHEGLEDWQIDAVFGAMWACLYLGRDAVPGHTFQVLTKRLARARAYFSSDRRKAWATAAARRVEEHADGIHDQTYFHKGPHPRIWIGASVENRVAKYRIDELRDIPAAVRFLSLEPLIEDVGKLDLRGIDWVIVGGESGNGARPFHVDWARSIVEQCAAAGVACFVKQLGAKPQFSTTEGYTRVIRGDAVAFGQKGNAFEAWPPELQVRQFPEVRRG